MNFNDYQLPDEKEYKTMNQSFNQKLHNESSELGEILKKMQLQRDVISRENTNGKYNEILVKYDNNIAELDRIISASNIAKQSLDSDYSTPYFHNSSSSVRRLENDGAFSPIRSDEEISRSREITNNISDSTPTPPNIPDRNNRVNNTRRNSPLQGNILSAIFEKFNIKNNSHSTDDGYRNKYHTTINNNCISIQKIRTNQADIVRLLLLYLVLNPHCRYCSRIASISNDQFMILNELN